jgi:hypothetical protein
MADQPSAQQPVALLGTGIMGAGMGRSMLRAGLPVRAWNRTLATAQALEPAGATIAATPADAVRDAGVIVTILSDGDAVLETMSAAVPGLREGQVWVQASTVGVAGLEPLAGLARAHGLQFMDAPVLGTRQPPSRARSPSSPPGRTRPGQPPSRSSTRSARKHCGSARRRGPHPGSSLSSTAGSSRSPPGQPRHSPSRKAWTSIRAFSCRRSPAGRSIAGTCRLRAPQS